MNKNKKSVVINVSMIILILFFLLSGMSIIFEEGYRLFLDRENIELIRLEIPWTHPLSDVTIMLDRDILINNPDIHKTVSRNILLYNILRRIVSVTLIILILYQLKNMLLAINRKTFFEQKNLQIIRNLSILVFIWVFCYSILYHLISLFIPIKLMYERINFVAFSESMMGSFFASIDFKMVLVGLILYVIAVLFKEGYLLKEQNDLTI